MYIFVLCSGSLKYYGVSTSWNVIEKHVNCTGICSSYLNLQENSFFDLQRQVFCLRISPTVNSSAVGQDLLNPLKQIKFVCPNKSVIQK